MTNKTNAQNLKKVETLFRLAMNALNIEDSLDADFVDVA